MLVKACVNGARTLEEHPALSAEPDDMAADCVEAIMAGAGAIHVHPKEEHGQESLVAADVDRWVKVLRYRCPGTPIGVTTGEWAMPDLADRLREIEKWQELPDFASVNWHEDGADEVAVKLISRGIGVEAGIWHREGLQAWAASPVRSQCLRVLVEVQDMAPDEARKNAKTLVRSVLELEPEIPVLLHGEERSTWAAIELAGELRVDTRAGLEDCLTLPDGSVASGNADLIRAAMRIMSKNA